MILLIIMKKQKNHKPEEIEIKKKDRNLIWPLLSGDKYRGVNIRFVK